MGFSKRFGIGAVLAVFLTAFLTSSCKQKVKEQSALQNEDSAPITCPCSDLACWDKATANGVSRQLSCVGNALSAAASVSGLALAEIGVGVVELGIALNDRDLLTSLGAIAGEPGAILEFMDKGTPLGECLAEGSKTLKEALNFAAAVQQVKDNSVASYANILKIGQTGIEASFRFGATLTKCAAIADKATGHKSIATFKQFSKGFEKVISGFKVVIAFVDCGSGISQGIITLTSNSQCLLTDLANLQKSHEMLDRQRDKLHDNDSPNGNCNNEPDNCNVWAMEKFGEHLRRTTLYIQSRPSYCAESCSDTGRTVCEQSAKELFGSEYDACLPICQKTQCSNAVDVCISLCCGQDGPCTNKAQKILGR